MMQLIQKTFNRRQALEFRLPVLGRNRKNQTASANATTSPTSAEQLIQDATVLPVKVQSDDSAGENPSSGRMATARYAIWSLKLLITSTALNYFLF